jgi:uncharacterized RDD family membrane protein YckC
VIGYFFDLVIDGLVFLTLMSVLKVRFEVTVTGAVRPESDQAAAALVTTMLLWTLYYIVSKVLMLGFLGATPGMFMMSLRCVRWDGRPCGIFRAFIRTLVMGLVLYAGLYIGMFLALGGAYIVMWTTKGHKNPGDYLAGTFVIDSIFKGRLIIENSDGIMVGPSSVTREEAEEYLKQQAQASGLPAGFVPPLTASAKNGTPFIDKNLDTYVVWNHKQEAWLAFDKQTGLWHQIS